MKDVTAAIIRKGDTVLLARRAPGQKNAGKWEFPGGKVEPGESLGDCLRRELREELQIEASVGRVLGDSVYRYEHGAIRLIAIEASILSGEIRLSVHDAVEWVPVDRLLTYDLSAADIPIADQLPAYLAKAREPEHDFRASSVTTRDLFMARLAQLAIAAVLVLQLLMIFAAGLYFSTRLETPKIVKKAFAADNLALSVSGFGEGRLRALLTVEDPGFYRHRGVDLRTPGAGMTTISQALVKQLYFKHFKSGPLAKLMQSFIARFVFDPKVPKRDQLTLFINNVYLGEGPGGPVRGFHEAARAYFGKSVSALSEDEYLSLVAMIIAPNAFHVVKCPAANAERVARIRKLLSGEYRPRALMDVYYGPLDGETAKKELPLASYFPSLYR